jgi:excisionase family DNA binding protein
LATRQQHEQPRPRLYGRVDAAAYLSVSVKEVQRLITRGDLFSVKLGRRRLIPAEELDRYVARLIVQAEAAG